MVTYDTRRARPPYIIGMSLQQVCKKFGVSVNELEPTVKESTPKETVVEKPVAEEVVFVEPVIEEPVVEELIQEDVITEPVAEEPVAEEVEPTTEATATPLEVLELSAKNIKILQFNNINTVEELLALDIDLEDLPKIGRAAKQAIMEGLSKWQNAQNAMTSTNEN